MAAAIVEDTVPAVSTDLAFLRLGAREPFVVMPGGPRFGYVRPGFDLVANGLEIERAAVEPCLAEHGSS